LVRQRNDDVAYYRPTLFIRLIENTAAACQSAIYKQQQSRWKQHRELGFGL